MNQEELQKIIEQVKEQTKKEAYSLIIDTKKEPGLFDSKFGGVPYWDMEKEYPQDSFGDKLMLLAQFNLEQSDFEGLLPTKGILQFYIGIDDMLGIDFDQPENQDGFRVVYHEHIKTEVTKDDVLGLAIPMSTSGDLVEFSPIEEEYAVEVVKKEVSMGVEDFGYPAQFYEASKRLQIELGEDMTPDELMLETLGEEKYYETLEQLSNTGHWVLGYPMFAQSDIREGEYGYYDTLLFQMGSESEEDRDLIMWGDGGFGNFFINHEDLKRGDFSKIVYNWDCY